jgi:hypothetical protein
MKTLLWSAGRAWLALLGAMRYGSNQLRTHFEAEPVNDLSYCDNRP